MSTYHLVVAGFLPFSTATLPIYPDLGPAPSRVGFKRDKSLIFITAVEFNQAKDTEARILNLDSRYECFYE